ncbi:MAG TPA: tetratricopeptide repeat protein [Bryobacteraceae bacterium]|nr:tetratricopeptide repeat protein [Bryobacteraceae bacterium]
MWYQRSQHLLITAAVVALFSPVWVAGQDQPAAAQSGPKYKDQGEYTLYDSILKDTNPKTKLDKLQEWQTKYPTTEFAKPRQQLFLDTYVKLNQPKEAVAAAKQILADDPKDFTSLYYTMYFTRALAGNNPTPEVLDQGEKAATGFLANIDTPPPNVTAEQWKGARTPMEVLAHSTLGWIAMQRKSWDAAEAEFEKSLVLDPNNGEVDFFMGTVLASEKNPQKMPAAFFYFARAATNEGAEGLAPAGRQQALSYVQRAYKGYHGSDEGFSDLVAMAKAQSSPGDYHIRTAKDIADERQKKQEEEDAKNPQLKLWKDIKSALTGPDGASYFSMNMKDAQLPTLKGKVIKLEPELKPKTLVLALEDGTTPDATLKFEMALPGKVDPGTELSFEGVPESYTASPYMVVFNVEPDKLHGWTGKNAPHPHAKK